MMITQALLDELKNQSDISWHQSIQKSPTGGLVIASFATDEQQAANILKQLNPRLGAALHACSVAGKWRVQVDHEKVQQLLANNEPFAINGVKGLLYTQTAKQWHGDKPISFRGEQWEQFGAETDFSDPKTPTKMVSLVANDTVERLFFDQNSIYIQHLISSIEAQSARKSIEETLELVNTHVDDFSTKHPLVAHQARAVVEAGLNKRLTDYITKRQKGEIAERPANADITMDEIISEGLLVCRHKAILAASLIGALIRKKLLPEGSARQYRNLIHDNDGREAGAHAWAVYHDATTDIMRVIDPRWRQVKIVDPNKPQDMGYGVPAVREMIQRIEAFDKDKIESVLKAAIQNATSLTELTQLMENFAQKHDIVSTDGVAWKNNQKQALIDMLKLFSQDPAIIAQIANGAMVSSQITRNYGLREKFIALAKDQTKINMVVMAQEVLELHAQDLPGNLSKRLIQPCLVKLSEISKMPVSEEQQLQEARQVLEKMKWGALRENGGELVMAVVDKVLETITPKVVEEPLIKPVVQGLNMLPAYADKKNKAVLLKQENIDPQKPQARLFAEKMRLMQ